MFSKLRTLTVVCSAVLAISAVSMACPNAKQVAVKSQTGTQKIAVVQVADGTQKQCSKSRQASTIAVASKKAGCAKSAATTETLALLAKAIRTMPDDAARANVVTAYRTMAKANPSLVCEKQCAAVKAVLAGGSTCGSAKARNTQVANTISCDPVACAAFKGTKILDAKACAAACAAAKAKQVQVVAGQIACSKASKATRTKQVKNERFVAFGCNKTDKLARAAANGYLDVMRALQVYSGADGCAASCASKLLAQVLADKSAQAQTTKTETVANIETPVSLGAVSDVKTTKRSQCSYGKK